MMDARIQVNGVWYLQESLVMSTQVATDGLLGQLCGVTKACVLWTPERQEFFDPWLKRGNLNLVPLLPGDGWRFLPRGVSTQDGDMFWYIPYQAWQRIHCIVAQSCEFDHIGPYRRRIETNEKPVTVASTKPDPSYFGLERYLGKQWVDRNDDVTEPIELSDNYHVSEYKLQALVRRVVGAPAERRTWTAQGKFIRLNDAPHPFDLVREYVPPEVKPTLVREYTHVMWLEPVWAVDQPTGSVPTGRIGYVHVNPPEA